MKVRRDWEGADPLKCLMEAYFMMSVEPLDEVMDGNVSFSGRKCSALSVSERLAILHGAAEGYDLRGELRTAGFRKGLKDSVEKSGFRLDMEYSDPMPLKGGRTENCVQQDCRLRITDLVNDRLIWSGCASVVEEGTDAARMRALRSVLEAAGFFSPLDRSGDIRTGRYEGFHSPIDWTGEKYLQ